MAEPMHKNEHLMKWATYASVTTAIILILIKLFAWLQTGSISLLSTLIDSLLDSGASIINLFAVRYALMPPDKEHRFGHGKAEPLASLFQAAFISASALFLIIKGVSGLFDPPPIQKADLGITVTVITLFLTVCLIIFLNFVIRKTGSTAIRADATHYKSDILLNIGVLSAIALSSYADFPLIDPLFALGIAIYILWSVRNIAADALDQLMDREFAPETRQHVQQIINEHVGVIGYHDLRTRTSGLKSFIQVHIELDGDQPLRQAHDIAEDLEQKLLQQFPGSEVIIHQDPFHR